MKYTQEIFIEKAKKKYKNRYSYNKVIYKNAKSRVIITCKKHGDFEIKPCHFLSRDQCSYCASYDRHHKENYKKYIKTKNKLYMLFEIMIGFI